jgi:hypothetical protein
VSFWITEEWEGLWDKSDLIDTDDGLVVVPGVCGAGHGDLGLLRLDLVDLVHVGLWLTWPFLDTVAFDGG